MPFRTLRLVLAAAPLLAMLPLAPAAADVAIVQEVNVQGMGNSGGGQSTVYIKGLKMRTEQDMRGDQMVSILDLEKQQMINLDMKKQRADVFDLRQVGEQMNQFVDATSVSVSLEPNGATETVAGTTCQVYDLKVKLDVEMAPGSGMGATMVMNGTSCLVADAPGAADYQRFYQAMAERGLFFGDPRAAQGPGAGQQKGMTELYSKMAAEGVAYHSDVDIGFEGSGMMAKMFERLAFDTETTVKSVSTDTLSDDLFSVPAGWKVKDAN